MNLVIYIIELYLSYLHAIYIGEKHIGKLILFLFISLHKHF